ncbi:GH3 family domain-containing protein [Synoicihabitans lomoniglobus]|uniref:GH3 auxin-responsive promoter family protein n=1 Tax=Synoicihabitans lomoniglobus TaxID=2909285 RepID=A0AAE9ZRL1_9BACT|nr:GH3 auxin-responsive promoter family protein [Opitutaceae bacterium LMO-M01]WED63960.1 GH3 auxin-responsive promoter family protein [Opitutaceae bacterium LMO-M01]
MVFELIAEFTKPWLTFGAQCYSAWVRRRLQTTRYAGRHQERILRTLLKEFAQAGRYRGQGITPRMPLQKFKSKVPVSFHKDLIPWVDRMILGETDLLWPGSCDIFVQSAGTTTGSPRTIPVTFAMEDHFVRATRTAVLHATARGDSVDAIRGKILLVGGNTLHPPASRPTLDAPDGPIVADMVSLAMILRPPWAARYFIEPSAKISLLTDWPQMVERIVRRTHDRDITALAGNLQWLTEFARQTLAIVNQRKVRFRTLRDLWPDLASVIYFGISPEVHLAELQRLVGVDVQTHQVYAAAEGVYAAQGMLNTRSMQLIYDAGIYFEFIPLDTFDRLQQAQMGEHALSLSEIEPNRDYVMLVSTPAGLLRQVVGDIVRFSCVRPPMLKPVGQLGMRLNQWGENILDHDLTAAISEICRSHQWALRHFHVAPLTIEADLGRETGRHEWWIELQSGTVKTPTGPPIAAEIDQHLCQIHPAYRQARATTNLEAPVVRLVMPGAFEHWIKQQRRWGGPHKLPACRSDRRYADELAKIARFSAD